MPTDRAAREVRGPRLSKDALGDPQVACSSIGWHTQASEASLGVLSEGLTGAVEVKVGTRSSRVSRLERAARGPRACGLLSCVSERRPPNTSLYVMTSTDSRRLFDTVHMLEDSHVDATGPRSVGGTAG
jgi:hypothetical protein